MHVAGEEAEVDVAAHGARQQPRLEQDLEAVADPQDEPAGIGVALHRGDDRRPCRHHAGADVVAVGEAAGQHDELAPLQRRLVVPEEGGRLPEDVLPDVVDVVIAVAAGEDDDAGLQRRAPFFAAAALAFAGALPLPDLPAAERRGAVLAALALPDAFAADGLAGARPPPA